MSRLFKQYISNKFRIFTRACPLFKTEPPPPLSKPQTTIRNSQVDPFLIYRPWDLKEFRALPLYIIKT